MLTHPNEYSHKKNRVIFHSLNSKNRKLFFKIYLNIDFSLNYSDYIYRRFAWNLGNFNPENFVKLTIQEKNENSPTLKVTWIQVRWSSWSENVPIQLLFKNVINHFIISIRICNNPPFTMVFKNIRYMIISLIKPLCSLLCFFIDFDIKYVRKRGEKYIFNKIS